MNIAIFIADSNGAFPVPAVKGGAVATLVEHLVKEGNKDKAIELLDDLALNILYDENNKGGDPFWEKTSADYFSGVALGLFEDAKPDEININSISLATSVGEDKFGGSTYIKEYFQGKDPTSASYIKATSTVMKQNKVFYLYLDKKFNYLLLVKT